MPHQINNQNQMPRPTFSIYVPPTSARGHVFWEEFIAFGATQLQVKPKLKSTGFETSILQFQQRRSQRDLCQQYLLKEGESGGGVYNSYRMYRRIGTISRRSKSAKDMKLLGSWSKFISSVLKIEFFSEYYRSYFCMTKIAHYQHVPPQRIQGQK